MQRAKADHNNRRLTSCEEDSNIYTAHLDKTRAVRHLLKLALEYDFTQEERKMIETTAKNIKDNFSNNAPDYALLPAQRPTEHINISNDIASTLDELLFAPLHLNL